MNTGGTLLVLALTLASITHFGVVPGSAVQVINVPGDYSSIQSAINAAGQGDRIVVEPGNYNETLSITLPVVIEGRNRQTTVLNATGGGPGIRIQATGVRVSNLTIVNVGSSLDGVLIENSSNITISRVDILLERKGQYSNGTHILASQKVKLEETRISGADLYGIAADRGGEHSFLNNELTDNLVGIGVFRGSATVILGNRVVGPGETGVQIGYIRASSRNTVVAYNAIDDFTSSGIVLYDSYENVLQENVITRIEDPVPGAFAAAVRLQNSTRNAIFLNDLANIPDYYAQGVFIQDRTSNAWNSYNGLGNYWDNYQGLDDGSVDPRTGESRKAGDGVGDTGLPHVLFDYYPLMQAWNNTTRAPVGTLRVLVVDGSGKPVNAPTLSSTGQPEGQGPLLGSLNSGNLTFYGVVAGEYTLSATAPGYEPQSKVVRLVPRAIQNETLSLTATAAGPLAVQVLLYAVAGAIVVAVVLGIVLRRRRPGQPSLRTKKLPRS